MKSIFAVPAALCMCFLSGCLKKTPHRLVPHSESNYNSASATDQRDLYKKLCTESWTVETAHDSVSTLRQQEARLIDIPIPIHAESLGFHKDQVSSIDKDSLVLAYRVYSKQQDIGSFFMIEMERLGWNMIANVQDVESLLVFVKPTKICTISLRSIFAHDASSLIVITYGNTNAGYSP